MIKLRGKIGFGFGNMSTSMFWKLFGAYLMVFCTDIFGISGAVVGTIFAIARI
jgi:GPH family glycoside/pentoside/hexuronide:cation symporter